MKSIRPYILVVEDSKIASAAAASVLTELNCLVDFAEGGLKALRLVKKKHYDMIFMDLGLSDVDGMSICEKIKEIEGAENIPVIALTAYTDDSLKERCFRIGMMGFVTKPLTAEKASFFLKKFLPDFS